MNIRSPYFGIPSKDDLIKACASPPTPLAKATGLQCKYVFENGTHLNLFGVKEINLDGEWYRVTDHEDRLHVINKSKVLYITQKQVK
jgi:hypothetical protein